MTTCDEPDTTDGVNEIAEFDRIAEDVCCCGGGGWLSKGEGEGGRKTRGWFSGTEGNASNKSISNTDEFA